MDAIVFDFDGVIHDTFELAYGIFSGLNQDVSREQYRALFDGNVFASLDDYLDARQRRLFREREAQLFVDLRVEESVRASLKELAAEHDLYVISSNTESNIHTYLSNNALGELFVDVLAEETDASKKEKFRILFDRYGLEAGDCVFVTDTLGDLRAADSVGVRAIAVDYGFHGRKRLEQGDPCAIVSEFSALPGVISGMD